MAAQVVFFGSSPLSNIVLQKLLDASLVSAVVTKADKPTGRHLKLTPNPVKVLAEKNNIPVSASAPGGEMALVAAYGKIIPQSVLDTFNGQIYNIHPSLLPKYRGPSPLQQQILDGVTATGVTIIQLDAQMDHGPIVAQSKDKVLPDDTWQTLGGRLFAKGADLFITSLLSFPSPESGEGSGVRLKEQDDSAATYTKMLTRQDGFVPWKEFKPQLLERKLRAFADWPGVWTTMPDGKRLKLISLKPEVLIRIEGRSPQLLSTL